jgi:signal peptidase I
VASSDDGSGGSLLELVLVVALALGLALGIQALIVKPYKIPSESMVPTLTVGQRVLVNRIGERFSDPAVGDVIVFHPPSGAEEENSCGTEPPDRGMCPKPTGRRAEVTYIKRVVGVPGDRISLVGGHVIRNARKASEPFMRPCGPDADCDFPTTIVVPAGHYFMMGDNRGGSDDSRYWGPVPRDWIIGGAFGTYWPPSRIGLL